MSWNVQMISEFCRDYCEIVSTFLFRSSQMNCTTRKVYVYLFWSSVTEQKLGTAASTPWQLLGFPHRSRIVPLSTWSIRVSSACAQS